MQSYLGGKEEIKASTELKAPSPLLEKQRRAILSPRQLTRTFKLWEFVPGVRGMLMGASEKC